MFRTFLLIFSLCICAKALTAPPPNVVECTGTVRVVNSGDNGDVYITYNTLDNIESSFRILPSNPNMDRMFTLATIAKVTSSQVQIWFHADTGVSSCAGYKWSGSEIRSIFLL